MSLRQRQKKMLLNCQKIIEIGYLPVTLTEQVQSRLRKSLIQPVLRKEHHSASKATKQKVTFGDEARGMKDPKILPSFLGSASCLCWRYLLS